MENFIVHFRGQYKHTTGENFYSLVDFYRDSGQEFSVRVENQNGVTFKVMEVL